jgi:drug/metabolite transporter (DMT)-like permease
MLNILLAVLAGVLVLIVLKLFPKYGVDSLIAIIFNYVTAALTGILFMKGPFSFNEIVHSSWFILSIPLGGLFIGVFYLMSVTAQRISISTTSIANKMSVAMPVLFSIIFLKQELSVFKAAGIVLALIAVYLSAKRDKSNSTIKSLAWLPVLVFIGSGIIDTCINACNAYFIKSNDDAAMFTITTFLAAFGAGIIVILFRLLSKKTTAKQIIGIKNVFAGIALGIPNYFSIYFIFKALDSSNFTSAQLFPLLNLSNVVLSALVAFLLFKEKLSPVNIAGIFLAVISIILIAL